MDFKVNEYGEIIREDNELFALEQKYLKGVPLNIEVRKRLAAESQNLQVLEACLKERAITVRRIVWDNPHLTPEMRMEATRQMLIDKSSAGQVKNPVKPATVNPKTTKINKTFPIQNRETNTSSPPTNINNNYEGNQLDKSRPIAYKVAITILIISILFGLSMIVGVFLETII